MPTTSASSATRRPARLPPSMSTSTLPRCTIFKTEPLVAKRPARQHRKLPLRGTIKPAVLFAALDDAPAVGGAAQPVDVATTDVEESDATVGGARPHRVEEQRPAGCRVAVDHDLAVGNEMLPHREVRQHLREPAADLRIRPADAARGGVVDGRVRGEHGVEQRPVERVDRPGVAGEERVDLEPVRDLLHAHHGDGQPLGATKPAGGAPAAIHSVTRSIAVGLSFLRPRGMRSPSFGSSAPLSLSRMKLLAGLPGSTRSLPAAAATGFVGGTPTRSSYASVGASESRCGDWAML